MKPDMTLLLAMGCALAFGGTAYAAPAGRVPGADSILIQDTGGEKAKDPAKDAGTSGKAAGKSDDDLPEVDYDDPEAVERRKKAAEKAATEAAKPAEPAPETAKPADPAPDTTKPALPAPEVTKPADPPPAPPTPAIPQPEVVKPETPPPPPKALPVLRFSTPSLTVHEGEKVFTVTILLSAPSDTLVRVTYTSGGGTATADQDYVPAAGTLEIPAGEMGKTFDIVVRADSDPEGDEIFEVTLSKPENAELEATPKLTVMILDDDAADEVPDVDYGHDAPGPKPAPTVPDTPTPEPETPVVEYTPPTPAPAPTPAPPPPLPPTIEPMENEPAAEAPVLEFADAPKPAPVQPSKTRPRQDPANDMYKELTAKSRPSGKHGFNKTVDDVSNGTEYLARRYAALLQLLNPGY